MDDFKVMTAQEVRDFDSRAINDLGIPGIVLMENAGRGCADVIYGSYDPGQLKKVAVFCGLGNNGGDGYVIARHLINSGFGVDVYICGDKSKISGDAEINLNILENIQTQIYTLDVTQTDLKSSVTNLIEDKKYTLIVDAIFGTGLSGTLRDGYPDIIRAIAYSSLQVVSVDIPSGLDCDTGNPLTDSEGEPAAVKADITVTFVAVKKGFYDNPDSSSYTGEVFIASIGVEPE